MTRQALLIACYDDQVEDAAIDSNLEADTDTDTDTDADADADFDTDTNVPVDDTGEEYEEEPVPDNCVADTYEGSDDLFCEASTWDSAKTFCYAQGYEMVTIQDYSENAFITTTVPKIVEGELGALELETGNRNLGLDDRDVEGDFAWEDGSDLSYENWNDGEPNDAGSAEDCGMIYTHDDATGLWNDIPSNRAYPFICELD